MDDEPAETVFLPIHETHRDWLELYYPKLLCFKREDLWLHGDYNSQTARMINVQLRKCRDRPDCKSDEEILEYFRGRYIMILHNQIRFDARKYGEDSIVAESRFKWLRINT